MGGEFILAKWPFFLIPFVYNIYTNVQCNVRYFVHVIQIKHSLNQTSLLLMKSLNKTETPIF